MYRKFNNAEKAAKPSSSTTPKLVTLDLADSLSCSEILPGCPEPPLSAKEMPDFLAFDKSEPEAFWTMLKGGLDRVVSQLGSGR